MKKAESKLRTDGTVWYLVLLKNPVHYRLNFYLDAGKGLGLDVEVMDLLCEEGHSRAVLVVRLEGLNNKKNLESKLQHLIIRETVSF
jgi:hypothetical protein